MDNLPEPVWDDQITGLIVKRDDTWIVSVAPMLFNTRLTLTHVSQYPLTWTSGYCYDPGPAAALAARAWNPHTEPHPPGFTRIAADDTAFRACVAANRGAA